MKQIQRRLFKWRDIAGIMWILNPDVIAHVHTIGNTGKVATVVFTTGDFMQIGSHEIPQFTREWYAALNNFGITNEPE